MRAWAFMLGGMIVWAVHFFALYTIASVFLTTPTARFLTILVTLLCLAADGGLLALALKARRETGDGPAHWAVTLAALMRAISLVAVLWQGLPALLA